MTIVGKLTEFESGVARKITVDGVAVAVVRIDDEMFAIADRCSHAEVSLSEGVVWCETKQLECIKHGSAFSLVTGVPITLPATQPVTAYNTAIVNGDVVVTLKEAQS